MFLVLGMDSFRADVEDNFSGPTIATVINPLGSGLTFYFSHRQPYSLAKGAGKREGS